MVEKRSEYEKRVMKVMTGIYCRHHHHTSNGDLCVDCRELLGYSLIRIERCPKGERKKSCRKCEIHCYSSEMRRRIREVMRYVGPRMLFIHPVMAIRHLMSEYSRS